MCANPVMAAAFQSAFGGDQVGEHLDGGGREPRLGEEDRRSAGDRADDDAGLVEVGDPDGAFPSGHDRYVGLAVGRGEPSLAETIRLYREGSGDKVTLALVKAADHVGQGAGHEFRGEPEIGGSEGVMSA